MTQEEVLKRVQFCTELYDATIINFWSNGCGSCIEEMPELEEYYQ